MKLKKKKLAALMMAGLQGNGQDGLRSSIASRNLNVARVVFYNSWVSCPPQAGQSRCPITFFGLS
jgi:hypothetical protein